MDQSPTTPSSWEGIHDNQTNEEYHQSPGFSASGMKVFGQKSPAHYQQYLQEKREPTPAMIEGTLIHMAVLEPHLIETSVAVAPPVDRRTTAGKQTYADFLAASEGKLVVSRESYEKLVPISQRILNHPVARSLLTGGRAEVSCYWTDPSTKLLLKCRPDYLRDDGIVVDVKTTDDASFRQFQRKIVDLGYHWATAHYLDGISLLLGKTVNTLVHLVIEREPPFEVSLYVLDDASIERAREDVVRFRERFKTCMETNSWPGYDTEVQNMNLPSWAF